MRTSDDLITAVKRTGFLPDANDFTDEDILDFADSEMLTLMSMVLKNGRDEFWVKSIDIPLQPGITRYRCPRRALGRALRGVILVSSEGNQWVLDQIDPVAMRLRYASQPNQAIPAWFSLEGDFICLGSSPTIYPQLLIRVLYLVQPSKLVPVEEANPVVSFTANTINIQPPDPGPAYPLYTTNPGDFVDVVSGQDPHDTALVDLEVQSFVAPTITFTESFSTEGLTTFARSVRSPDYVCPAGTTVYPSIPAVLWTALVRGTTRAVLDSIRDPGAGRMGQLASEAREAAVRTLEPRDMRSSEKIIATNSPLALGGFRRGRGRSSWGVGS
jgi:hypothetical protein